MTTTTITGAIDAFVESQNKARGGSLAGGGTVALDYDALTGTVPAGGNAVTGFSGIPSNANGTTIALPAGQLGNTLMLDGSFSTTASTSGPDSYSAFINASGQVQLTDNNTHFSVTVTNVNYIVTNGGGAGSTEYIIATGVTAQIALMYQAELQRAPDLPGLEYYVGPTLKGVLTESQDSTFSEASPEFKALYPALSTPSDHGGPNDQEFVSELYTNILHRTPSASELAFYDSYMAGTLTGQSGYGNRADLGLFFANSPENVANTSGWLINPTNGPVNIGALSTQAATSLLTTEVSSGTINAADFPTFPSNSTTANGNVTDAVAASGVTVYGPSATAFGHNTTIDTISITSAAPANLTVNLNTQYFSAAMDAQNTTVNGVSAGGTLIHLPDHDAGGVVNFSANGNWAVFYTDSTVGNVTVPTVINGWNSTDVIGDGLIHKTGSTITYGFASAGVLAGHSGVVLNASPSSPVSLAAYEQSPTDINPSQPYAVYLGNLADDTITTAIATINSEFHVLGLNYEAAIFYGQDTHGDTMVFAWNPAVPTAGAVQETDITGVIKLVGVSAASLTGANFHN